MTTFRRHLRIGKVWALTLLVGMVGLAGLVSTPAQAELDMAITTEGVRQIPLALLPLAQENLLPSPVLAVVQADLVRSGLFRAVDISGIVPLPSEAKQIRMADFRARDARQVLTGSVQPQADGRFQLRVQLVDAVTEAVRINQSFTVAPAALRQTAHQIADEVYQELTGERGAFSTRIAYIVKGGGRYQLKVADADAYNEQTVLSSREPIISPRWSPDGKRMAYVSFELNRPSVVVQNLATGERKTVANFKGNNSAPAWSPDGRQLAVTLSRDGIAQIYVMPADGSGLPRRVMTTRAIDTEACFTPDGTALVFTSDRGGSPQIYRVPLNGGNAQRLTFSGAYNVSPRISPDGSKMTYVQQSGSVFRVMLQDLDSGQTQTLTDTQLDESPSFSPNGRIILYATRVGGRGVLAMVSADGRVRQRFTTQAGDVYEPAWGPYP